MRIDYNGYRIFAFADLHGMYRSLHIPPDMDILICAGDVVHDFPLDELEEFFAWFAAIPAKLRVFVAGNHELAFDLQPDEATSIIPEGIVLLENDGICFDGIYFYSVAARAWLDQETTIPEKTDFLITHGPGKGFLDEGHGCPLLRRTLLRERPRYHLFGHIHSLGGQQKKGMWTVFCNISYYNHLRHLTLM